MTRRTDPPPCTSNRRAFLKTLAGLALAPSFVPGSVLGKDGAVSPSNRITLATIGLGGRNTSNLSHFLLQKDVQCVAV